MEWQPIETAPKDGTTVLVMTKPGLPYAAEFRAHRMGEPVGDIGIKHWRATCCGRYSHPTHWTPIKPAPEGTK